MTPPYTIPLTNHSQRTLEETLNGHSSEHLAHNPVQSSLEPLLASQQNNAITARE